MKNRPIMRLFLLSHPRWLVWRFTQMVKPPLQIAVQLIKGYGPALLLADQDMVGSFHAMLRQNFPNQLPKSPFHAVAYHRIANFLGHRDAISFLQGRRAFIRVPFSGQQDKARRHKPPATIGPQEIGSFGKNGDDIISVPMIAAGRRIGRQIGYTIRQTVFCVRGHGVRPILCGHLRWLCGCGIRDAVCALGGLVEMCASSQSILTKWVKKSRVAARPFQFLRPYARPHRKSSFPAKFAEILVMHRHRCGTIQHSTPIDQPCQKRAAQNHRGAFCAVCAAWPSR